MFQNSDEKGRQLRDVGWGYDSLGTVHTHDRQEALGLTSSTIENQAKWLMLNPSTQEVGAGDLEVQGYLWLCCVCTRSLDYVRPRAIKKHQD